MSEWCDSKEDDIQLFMYFCVGFSKSSELLIIRLPHNLTWDGTWLVFALHETLECLDWEQSASFQIWLCPIWWWNSMMEEFGEDNRGAVHEASIWTSPGIICPADVPGESRVCPLEKTIKELLHLDPLRTAEPSTWKKAFRFEIMNSFENRLMCVSRCVGVNGLLHLTKLQPDQCPPSPSVIKNIKTLKHEIWN